MKKSVLKLTTIAALSAIGVLLMSVLTVEYPIFPYLKIEFSDFVVIFTFLLFGFEESFLVALIKTCIDMLFGLEGGVGNIPIVAHITALIASMSYVFSMWIVSKIIKSDKLGNKILKYSMVVLAVSVIMTFLNYMILTPLFLNEFTLFGIGMSSDNIGFLSGFSKSNNFFISVVVLMFPFNLLKGAGISVISILVGDRLLELFKNKIHKKE